MWVFSSSAPSASPTMRPRITARANAFGAIQACAPLSQLQDTISSPIGAYRWEFTDRALSEQLMLEDEGQPATVRAPAMPPYAMSTPPPAAMSCRPYAASFTACEPVRKTRNRNEVGSTIFQVFEGRGAVVMDGKRHRLDKGDLFVIPSWIPWSLEAESQFDLFRFSDAPIMERLHFMRTKVEGA